MKTSTNVLFSELFRRYEALMPEMENIRAAIECLAGATLHGSKLLVCGNGGSAADSEHIVGELMKGFLLPRCLPDEMHRRLRELYPDEANTMIAALQQAVPAISLASQTALMTAFGNDVSSQMVFAQQVLGYGRDGDILLAISTSGNSPNILYAARMAHVQGMKVISLTGEDGGMLKSLSDTCICAPSNMTFRIQEYHLPIYHCVCACVENELFGEEE